jgi:hypothetical protein
MGALVHCPPPLAGYTKAVKPRWSVCNPFVHAKINTSPYLESLVVLCFIGPQRKPTRLYLNLMVGQKEVLCDPIPWLTIVKVLLVNFQPEILVIELSNQKVDILTGVGHGLSLFVLKILLIGNLLTVTLQFVKQQELQTISVCGPPSIWIHLETLVRLLHAIDNSLQSNLTKSR